MTLDRVTQMDLGNQVRRLNNQVRELEIRLDALQTKYDDVANQLIETTRLVKQWPDILTCGDRMATLITRRAEYVDRLAANQGDPSTYADKLEQNRKAQHQAAAAWINLIPKGTP